MRFVSLASPFPCTPVLTRTRLPLTLSLTPSPACPPGLLNQAWFTHCAGLEIRNAYHKRTDKVLSTQPQLAAQRHMFAEAAEEMLEHFRYSADEVEEAFRKQGRL